MKTILLFLSVIIAFNSSSSAEDVAHFEDEINSTDSEISSTIKSTKEGRDYSDCEIVYKKIEQKITTQKNYIYATTKDSCGKGNHAGPHWIIEKDQLVARVLLFDVGARVKMSKGSGAYPDFSIINTSSDDLIETIWTADENGNYARK